MQATRQAQMTRFVDIQYDDIDFTVGCKIHCPRGENPDNWWRESEIKSNDDQTTGYQHCAEKGWDWYDGLIETAEKALIDLLEEERSRYAQ